MAEQPVPPEQAVAQPAIAVRGERPEPVRNQDFDHLALEELRAYRARLAQQETRISYGRRVLQIAIADLREGRSAAPTRSALRLALELEAGRTAILALVPSGGLPELPKPGSLPEGDATGAAATATAAALVITDRQLGDYQESVWLRVSAATVELIARYRERPTLAVRALPLTPVVSPRDSRY